jgi:hypothetical protein
MRIRDQIAKTDGISHPYYIRSISNIAQSHTFLGESIETLQFLFVFVLIILYSLYLEYDST